MNHGVISSGQQQFIGRPLDPFRTQWHSVASQPDGVIPTFLTIYNGALFLARYGYLVNAVCNRR